MASNINFHQWIRVKQFLAVVWLLITGFLTAATSKQSDHSPLTSVTEESLAERDYWVKSDCYGAISDLRITTKDMNITYPMATTFKNLGFPVEYVNIQASSSISDPTRSCVKQDRAISAEDIVFQCSEGGYPVCQIRFSNLP